MTGDLDESKTEEFSDQIVDLSNDIFAVIQTYSPTGAPPYSALYDRGPSAGPNVWNMTAPDGVIDLSNDILGVIQPLREPAHPWCRPARPP